MNIFKPRKNIKPYEYPELLAFKDAIRHSYWVHTEFNITGDIQDYHTNISKEEKSVIKKCMLAISQIEVNVKRFWANLYTIFPKPEIEDVGATFAESEVRHKDAYSFLLEKLGLNSEFKNITNIKCLNDRIDYLDKILHNKKLMSNKNIVSKLVLFSILVEHISLFSQFLILMSFNKHKNLFKGISNIVEATSKEEEIHGRFGITLYEIIKKENEDKEFEKDVKDEVIRISEKAFKAEMNIIDWIYEEGDVSFIPKQVVKDYISSRFEKSLRSLGIDKNRFIYSEENAKKTEWFDLEILSTKENDFFYKRSTDYSKKTVSIEVEDLF